MRLILLLENWSKPREWVHQSANPWVAEVLFYKNLVEDVSLPQRTRSNPNHPKRFARLGCAQILNARNNPSIQKVSNAIVQRASANG
jgi:hypothetical protein